MPGTTFHLGLDSSPAIAGLNAFKGALGTVTSALAIVGIGFGAFKGAQEFTEALKGVWEQGKELSTLHSITGQSISDVVALRKAYSEAGIGAEEVAGDLTRLQKSLGGVNEEGQPTGTIFKQLGLNIKDLRGESAIAQLEHITGAVGRLGDQASKTFAITQIFGREGGHILALDTSSLEEARTGMAGLGAIMQRDAPLFKAIANDLEALKGKVRGFFVGFADTLSPVLLPLLDKLKAAINLTGFGQKIGAEVAQGAQVLYGLFQNGDLGTAAGLALRIGFTTATNWLAEKVEEVFDAWDASGPRLIASLKGAFDGIKEIFAGLGNIIAGSIVKGVATAAQGLTIGGHQIFDQATLASAAIVGDTMQTTGATAAQHGLAGLATNTGLGGLFKGLTTDSKDLSDELADLTATARETAAGFLNAGKKAEQAGPPGPGLNLSTIDKQQIQPLSDRLSKIGGFIGGNGGVLGERAAQDTARNTDRIATAVLAANQLLERIGVAVATPHAAVF